MVYVNSQKFACESCIKGHRSSSCHHTDRPLFEIKKKGRPVSQCQRCRDLRQSKKVHSKCSCNPKDDSAEPGRVLASATSKSRRYIPIVPALPNGLRDVLAASEVRTTSPADARQKVDSLLNPCNCKSVWKCNCNQVSAPVHTNESLSESTADLATLAHVAALRCCDSSAVVSSSLNLPDHVAKIPLPRTIYLPSAPKRPTSRPPSPTHKRSKQHHCSPVELPPIQSPFDTIPNLPHRIPDFGIMPPISTINSLAGSGCTCGVQCACPGCIEHRGSECAAHDMKDCKDGQCHTCVDNQSGIALPDSTSPLSSIPGSTSNFNLSLDYITNSPSLSRFFARAAALPLPPPNRRVGKGVQLDPRDLSSNDTIYQQVNLPKLECCGGSCSCPIGSCTCGTSCGGCCAADDASTKKDLETIGGINSDTHASLNIELVTLAPALSQRSCCTGVTT